MIPLKDIKPKSAKMKNKDGKMIISPADCNKSSLKRDVSSIVYGMIKLLLLAI